MKEGWWWSEYTKKKMICLTCEGKSMKEMTKNNKSSCRRLMNRYLGLEFSHFIFMSNRYSKVDSLIMESPGWWLQSIMYPSFVCHQSRIYVVLPGKLASLSFPENDTILLSLQDYFSDYKGNEPGNLNIISMFTRGGLRGMIHCLYSQTSPSIY